jgi:PAS domain S-box-containing protein
MVLAAAAAAPVRGAEEPTPGASARPRLVYGGNNSSPPFEYLDGQGTPQGFNVDLTRALAKEAGRDVEIRLGVFKEIVEQLHSGQIQLVTLGYSQARLSEFDYLPEVWTLRQVVFFLRGRPAYPQRIEDMSAERVAVQERSIVHDLLLRLPKDRRPVLLPQPNHLATVRLLVEGKATAAAGNSLVLRRALEELGSPNPVEVPIQVASYRYACDKGHAAEFDWIGPALERLKASGEYSRIVERHLAASPPAPSWPTYFGYGLVVLVVGVVAYAAATAWNRSLRQQVDARTQELRASEEKFAKAFRASPDGLLLASVTDSLIIDMNDGLALMTGYSRAEMIGRSPEQLGLFVEPARWRELCARSEGAERLRNIDLQVRTKSGAILETLVSGERFRIGDRACLLGVLRDVTERRRIETLLAHQDRLKSEFVAMAAHELKTPVTVMKGYAQVLLASEDIDEAKAPMLAAIDRGADRITRVVEDLLDVTRLQIGRFELGLASVDLPEVVEQVAADMVQRSPRHRLTLNRCGPLSVRGDRERLAQVFANLVGNAIKYSPGGGEVAVSVARLDGRVEVSVRDEGVGIPADRQAGLFERFYRAHAGTRDDFGGMGVGLFISQEIVARHGGRISFSSAPGHGSTFVVHLPVDESSVRGGGAAVVNG